MPDRGVGEINPAALPDPLQPSHVLEEEGNPIVKLRHRLEGENIGLFLFLGEEIPEDEGILENPFPKGRRIDFFRVKAERPGFSKLPALILKVFFSFN